jgi:hypothetical protein
MEELEQTLFCCKFNRNDGDVRCCTHIYNITVQAGMSILRPIISTKSIALKGIKSEIAEHYHYYQRRAGELPPVIKPMEIVSKALTWAKGHVHFENTCRNMILDDHETLLTPSSLKLHNTLCNYSDTYCFTATMLEERRLHFEIRGALSKAFALIEQILRAEHPRTLACLFEVFIHPIQTGLPELTFSL